MTNLESKSSPEDTLDSLKLYISYVTEQSQQMMDSLHLKQCKTMLKNAQKLLEEVPSELQFAEGFHFMLNNNLAQLANKMGSVDASVQYLEQAV